MILIYRYTMERRCGQYSVTNCRCDVYAFNLRRLMCRPSMIDVSTFEDRCVDFRRSMIDVSTFEDRRSMCRLSKIGVSTFGDRCVDLRKSMIDVSIIEDRWSMWNYAAILAKNIDTIVVCELRRGFALQCFHCASFYVQVEIFQVLTLRYVGSVNPP